MSSYEELKTNLDNKWKSTQTKRAELISEMNQQIDQMPDVLNAPRAGEAWQVDDVKCNKCEGILFKVIRYVTINGLKHRAELECMECEVNAVYDFNEGKWLNCKS